MSTSGPTIGAMPAKKARDRRSRSASDSSLGSTLTPPFPPPYGMSSSAVFQVMRAAKHLNSSSEALGWYRRPPL